MSIEGSVVAAPQEAAAVIDPTKEVFPAETTAPEGEAPPAKEEAKPEEDPRFAQRFAALSRKEKTLSDREKSLKQQEQDYQSWKKSIETAKIDPIAFLQQHGLSFEQITDHLLSGGGKKELTADEKIEALQKQIEDDKKAREDETQRLKQADAERAIENHKLAIKQLVETKGDDFELVKAHEAYDMVWEEIEKHYNETNELLPIEDATKKVENYLEQYVQETILKTKKISSRLQQAPVSAEEPGPKTAAPATLTNKAQTQPAPKDGVEHLSEDDLRKRAVAMLRWT